MAEMIEFLRPDGKTCPGYLVGAPDAPGVVVVQEWWGLNAQIRTVADRLAEAGFRALVPDLYRGKVAHEPDEANHLMTHLDWGDAATQDVRGALQHLAANGKKAAVLGFCMGGALAILAGVHVPESAATVCYYGIPPADAADPAAMRVPFLGHFGSEDYWTTPAVVDGLEAALQRGGVKHEICRYPGLHHAFFNEANPRHDPAAAALSFTRSVDFLRAQLG
jgi:carboxymethylenebutenolidase